MSSEWNSGELIHCDGIPGEEGQQCSCLAKVAFEMMRHHKPPFSSILRVLLDTQAASFPYNQSCCHLGKTQCFFTSGCHQKWQPYGLLSEVSWNVETKPKKSWVVWAKGSLCRSLGSKSRTWINCWTRAVTCSICSIESATESCVGWVVPAYWERWWHTGHLPWQAETCVDTEGIPQIRNSKKKLQNKCQVFFLPRPGCSVYRDPQETREQGCCIEIPQRTRAIQVLRMLLLIVWKTRISQENEMFAISSLNFIINNKERIYQIGSIFSSCFFISLLKMCVVPECYNDTCYKIKIKRMKLGSLCSGLVLNCPVTSGILLNRREG